MANCRAEAGTGCPITANGSYALTCGNCFMDGCTLACICGDGRGGSLNTTLDVLACKYGSIWNEWESLRCSAARGTARMVGAAHQARFGLRKMP